jgi:hypothetical protein
MENTANADLLRTLIELKGGTTIVAYEADVGLSTLIKLMAGTYPAKPRRRLREKLCRYFKVKEPDLFPFVGAKVKQTA